MGYTRKFAANPGGPTLLDIKSNSVQFQLYAQNRRDILVELTTKDKPGEEAARLMDEAWGELTGGSYQLRVDNPNGVSNGGRGIQINNFGGGISVQNVSGNMSVIGGRVYVDGHEVTQSQGGASSHDITAKVYFPAHSPLRLETSAGDFEIDGQVGRLAAKLGAGDIRANRAGEVDIFSSSGDIRVDEVIGNAIVDTSSGDVVIGYVEGVVDFGASSGDIRVKEIVGNGRIKASSGDIYVGKFKGDSLILRTSSGDIEHPDVPGIEADTSSGDINGISPRRGRRRGW